MKRIKPILLGLLAIVAAVLLYAYLAYPAEYVNRVLRWGDADVYDYQKFPERTLAASDDPLIFPYNLDEEAVRVQFEVAAAMDDFGSFLAENRTQAFIVIQYDEIIYEQYFNGTDRERPTTPQPILLSGQLLSKQVACQRLKLVEINNVVQQKNEKLLLSSSFFFIWR